MPDYRYHISGQAIVTLAGKDFYLGRYDSPESRAKYFSLLAEYNDSGFKAPSSVTHLADVPVTVKCITAEFREYVPVKYASNKVERGRFENLCTLLEDEYGDTPAKDFGPRKLAALRDLFVASGNSRKYVNKQVRNIVRIFKHAISRELIDANVLVALESLEPLKAGQTPARETKPRQPVSLSVVRATAKHLSPTLLAMVKIQVATGMRPSEVFGMRPIDIDRSGDEWIYRPESHKTAHYGKTKAIPIIGDAKEALKPFLDRDPKGNCFTPKESAQWYRNQRTAKRATPDGPGRNKPGTNRKKHPKRSPGLEFRNDSYRQALRRAAEKAGVEYWYPYQLRHLAGTEVRNALGVEAAQALLGHSRAAMTEHYAKQNEAKAVEAAKAAPQIK